MNFRKTLIGLFLLVVPFYSHADKLEKAFERLKMYDYFSAKEIFEKLMKSEMPAAAYGLSSIYSTNTNPFYNTDSARKYILISDSTYQLAKEKKKKYYAEFNVNDSAIHALSELICADGFAIASKENTVNAYKHYLNLYRSCSQYEEAITMRNAAAFNDARTKNTSDAYKEFMALYPQSDQYEQAMSKYDERIYDENTADKTIESYGFFLQNYPESPYRMQAEKMIYALSIPHKSLKEYVAFVRENKDSHFANAAWREIYKLAMTDFSEESFANFKTTYPDYPFPDELETDFRLQNYFFLPFREEDSWGYINEKGDEMIKPVYDEISFFSESFAQVMDGGKYGYINKSGKTVIPFNFTDAYAFHNGCAVVKKDTLYGVINKNGDFLIRPEYEELSEAGEDVFMGVKDDYSGYVKKNGKPLSQFIYDIAGDFHDSYAIVNKDDKAGLINAGGSYNIEPQYEELAFINDSLLKAKNEDELWGIVTTQGQTIVPFVYEAIGEFSDHRALIAKNGKCGFVDETGAIVIQPTYRFSEFMLTSGKFENGFALLKQKVKSNLIDTSGKLITFPGYEDYGSPAYGLIPVKKNKKWGFAGFDGKLKIPCRYELVEPFMEGYATVRYNKLTGLIDTTGTLVIQPLYEDIVPKAKAILVKSGGKSGLLTKDGILLVPCQYDKIDFITDFIAKASMADDFTYINLDTGKIIYSTQAGGEK